MMIILFHEPPMINTFLLNFVSHTQDYKENNIGSE